MQCALRWARFEIDLIIVANLTAHFNGVPHDAASIEDRCGKFRNQGSKGRRHDN